MLVPLTITDGYRCKITTNFTKSLYIAYGSSCELETQMMLAGNLDYSDSDIIEAIMDKIIKAERMLNPL